MKFLIVEDELMIADDLQQMIAVFGYGDAVIATNYTEALEWLHTGLISFALLDIQLSGFKTGIDVAAEIKKHFQIPFIFLSSYEDLKTVNAALETKPYAYLQKPFNKTSLYSSIQLALSAYAQEVAENSDYTDNSLIIKDSFFVKEKNGFVRVPTKNILYIQSQGNYLELHTDTKKHLIREAQKNLLLHLPENFQKVNKSCIVNLLHLESVSNSFLTLANETEISLAPAYKNELMNKVKHFS